MSGIKVMYDDLLAGPKRMLRACVLVTAALASGILVSGAGAQQPAVPAAGKPSAAAAPYRYRPDRFAGRAAAYYKAVWGIDALSVKLGSRSVRKARQLRTIWQEIAGCLQAKLP